MTASSVSTVRAAPRWVLGVFALVLPALMIPLNLWFAESTIWRPMYDASLGTVHPTMLAGLVLIAVVVGGVVFGLGRFSPRDIGLEASKLPAGIAWTLAAWLLLQLVALAGSAAAGGGVVLADRWMPGAITYTTGALFGQLFGNALAEELLFRGFLLVQLYLILRPHLSQTRAVFFAIFFASLIFAVLHVPNRIYKGFDTADAFLVDQVVLILAGMLFGWAYWRTRNLFALVGFHSLTNQSSMLVEAPESWPDQLWRPVVLTLLAVYAWLCPARTRAVPSNAGVTLDPSP